MRGRSRREQLLRAGRGQFVVDLFLLHERSFSRGIGRSGEDRGHVLEQLDAAVEGAAADHLERNIRVTVVDAFMTGASSPANRLPLRSRRAT